MDSKITRGVSNLLNAGVTTKIELLLFAEMDFDNQFEMLKYFFRNTDVVIDRRIEDGKITFRKGEEFTILADKIDISSLLKLFDHFGVTL